jgi:type II secretory pathway pseudopilin PulG
MLAVVTIIGIFAAVAAPSFIAQMRDRRVSRVALQVAELYRMARSRALANGRATRFVWDSTVGPRGLAIVEQATDADPTCNSVGWGYITELNPSNSVYSVAGLQLVDPVGGAVSNGIVCFTPLGRAVKSGIGTPSAKMVGAARMLVTNTSTGYQRTVYLLPNGAARLVL